MRALRLLLVAGNVLAFAITGWRIGHLAQLEREDRELISGIEDNYKLGAYLGRLSR